MTPTASLVVLTGGRPDLITTCLEHVADLRHHPGEVVVADTSVDDTTARVVRALLPDATLVAVGPGPQPRRRARQLALDVVSGDVVAFIDDDLRVDPDWLGALLAPYADPAIVGVGGRVATGRDGEEHEGATLIGRLLPDGRLTDNFACDPGRQVLVHHLPEPAQSFRSLGPVPPLLFMAHPHRPLPVTPS